MHKPDFLTAQKLASVQGVLAAFLYTLEDDVADLIFHLDKATETERAAVRNALESVQLPFPKYGPA